MTEKSIVLTGATGYLGSWVRRALLAQGCTVLCLGSRDMLKGLNTQQWFLKRAGAVVHLAWYSSAGDKHPHIQDRCLQDTETLVDMVTQESSPDCKFIFASTASVYGSRFGDRELCEDVTPVPDCVYTNAKALAELRTRSAFPERHVVLRMGSLMGLGAPNFRTKTELVVNGLAVDGWRKREITYWHASAWKPVLHVQDAAEIIALLALSKGDRYVGTFNAAEGCYRAKDLAERAKELTGAEVVREVAPSEWAGYRSVRVDSTRLRQALPARSFRSVDDAVLSLRDYVPAPEDLNTPWAIESTCVNEKTPDGRTTTKKETREGPTTPTRIPAGLSPAQELHQRHLQQQPPLSWHLGPPGS